MVKGGKRYSSMSNDGKWKSPEYPFSTHDNRDAIRDSICAFSQHNTHFCLSHESDDPETGRGPPSSASGVSPAAHHHRAEPHSEKHSRAEDVSKRRFPRSHQERSAKAAAAARDGEPFMWFGRHDDSGRATNCVASRT
ncbi:hypothetical protein NHX12_022144 [Muraenolepis orangiensis]|uniref:Uncharacterized protein n=1 Tax=Muraenolepis orangiensis TaxID=630683 RepID=A0A9Q0EMM8_9TELE|nr:hypothetical protein NHX12_022144 [Muraenolepis orangiensis]